ncbi:uncharacterized protein LOC111829532 [Capsella rubella]|uniref:uncharacterized protein LOC111829532 n=1 Tax=Capsella rubella TaxID=81985 RepID=UPI000CD509A4|nr:uncharacterized protein LOC111829532 [Capsella rubella]
MVSWGWGRTEVASPEVEQMEMELWGDMIWSELIRGWNGRDMVRGGAVGRGRDRGRGRGVASGSDTSVGRSATADFVSESQSHQEGHVGGVNVSAVGAGSSRNGTIVVGNPVGGVPTGGFADAALGAVSIGPELQAPVGPEVQPPLGPGAVVEQPYYLWMLEQLQRFGMSLFFGGFNPAVADEWRVRLERYFQSMKCPKTYLVDLPAYYLAGDAHLWWRSVLAKRGQGVAEFNAKYFSAEALDRMESQFLSLTQGERSVQEYDSEFSRLLVYSGRAGDPEQMQVRQFMKGLSPGMKVRCKVRAYASRVELVEVAAGIEDKLRSHRVIPSPSVQPKKTQLQLVPS